MGLVLMSYKWRSFEKLLEDKATSTTANPEIVNYYSFYNCLFGETGLLLSFLTILRGK